MCFSELPRITLMSTTQEFTDIYSTYGGDPDLGELVEMFVDEMPDRVAALERAFGDGDLETLRRTAHQLKGAAGSYGFGQLTPWAAALEEAIRESQPEDAIEQALADLVALCGRVRAGEPQPSAGRK